jgi:hypothetical protein
MKSKSKLNREWHEKNRMPKNPTEEERAKWHKEHMKFCVCRAPSAKILELIRKIN